MQSSLINTHAFGIVCSPTSSILQSILPHTGDEFRCENRGKWKGRQSLGVEPRTWVAEHWWFKPEVSCMGSTPGDCWPFHFPLFSLQTHLLPPSLLAKYIVPTHFVMLQSWSCDKYQIYMFVTLHYSEVAPGENLTQYNCGERWAATACSCDLLYLCASSSRLLCPSLVYLNGFMYCRLVLWQGYQCYVPTFQGASSLSSLSTPHGLVSQQLSRPCKG